ncbi:hypothetical protein EVAR_30104_1 [Eumeta japonica]|uniref:Uncharacterized protein n=1 Tax=Eumeta variegata TaxID=151549 RepID=A0A4C1WJR0_EUMVA|nr:hypothetical protein EVAR_30104_1 [Eumeta japonica]
MLPRSSPSQSIEARGTSSRKSCLYAKKRKSCICPYKTIEGKTMQPGVVGCADAEPVARERDRFWDMRRANGFLNPERGELFVEGYMGSQLGLHLQRHQDKLLAPLKIELLSPEGAAARLPQIPAHLLVTQEIFRLISSTLLNGISSHRRSRAPLAKFACGTVS